MPTQAELDARAAVVRQATAALDALAIWELTQSTDLRRYERAGYVLDRAFQIESRYGTRVADVDPDRHGLAGNVRVGIVPDHVLARNPDYMTVEEAARRGINPYNGELANVRVCDPNDINDGQLAEATAAVTAATLQINEAELQLREAHRLIDRLPGAAADAVIDRVNLTNLGGPVLDAEALRREARIPPAVAAAIDGVNQRVEAFQRAGIEPRYGAPYDVPPGINTLAGLADRMGVPHMRPMMQAMEAAMAPLRPDPVTRLASRLTQLIDARAAMLSTDEEADVRALDRQIVRTQTELDQIESDNVPEPREPQTPGEI